MLRVLEEDMRRAQNQIRFINHEREFVGPIHIGYDYSYDELVLMFFEAQNMLPKTIEWRKFSPATNETWHQVIDKVVAKAQANGYDIFKVAKQFSTFDEFKAFVES
jgi:hypothetical protein